MWPIPAPCVSDSAFFKYFIFQQLTNRTRKPKGTARLSIGQKRKQIVPLAYSFGTAHVQSLRPLMVATLSFLLLAKASQRLEVSTVLAAIEPLML